MAGVIGSDRAGMISSAVRNMLLPVLLVLLPATAATVQADSKAMIDDGTRGALVRLREHSEDAGALVDKAAGVLVFPDVVKMGFGVGGEYGEGSLLVAGEPVAYYATAGASYGLQVGAQFKSEVILFMNEEVLADFRDGHGWEAGVDGSIAIVKLGGGGRVGSLNISEPVVGFIFSNKGLMYNLTLEGTKITRIAR
jgi:lipid-binding SYLF domain-containing protein